MAQTAYIYDGIMMDYNEELFRLQPSGRSIAGGQLWIYQSRAATKGKIGNNHGFPWILKKWTRLVMGPPPVAILCMA